VRSKDKVSFQTAAKSQLRHYHRDAKIYDLFEGTEQIQQLVISRAISSMGIE